MDDSSNALLSLPHPPIAGSMNGDIVLPGTPPYLANGMPPMGAPPSSSYRRPSTGPPPPAVSPSTSCPRSIGCGGPQGLPSEVGGGVMSSNPSNGPILPPGASPKMMPLPGMMGMGGPPPNLMPNGPMGIPLNAMPPNGPIPHHAMLQSEGPGPMPGMPPFMGRMALSPMVRQPDHRIYDMNKRLQYRPEDNDILWWEAFTNEFFEDNATLTLHFFLDDGPKRYTIGRILIPRYFRTIFEGGCCELYFVLRCSREIFQHTHLVLDCELTDMVMNMDRPLPVSVVAEGRLVLEFVCDEFMRIRSWTFAIRSHREMLFRSMLGVPDQTFLEGMHRNITRCGLTYHTLNFLRMCVILEPMQELMSRQKAYSLTPRDCLKTTLYQKWVKMVSPTETSRPANKKRKRKTAQNSANSDSNEQQEASNKKKPVSLPTLENAVGYGDVMIVGEPTLMGVNFGEEDERMITRMENVNYGSQQVSGGPLSVNNNVVNAGPSTPRSQPASNTGKYACLNNDTNEQQQQPMGSATPECEQQSQHTSQQHQKPVSVKSEAMYRQNSPGNAHSAGGTLPESTSWEAGGTPRSVQQQQSTSGPGPGNNGAPPERVNSAGGEMMPQPPTGPYSHGGDQMPPVSGVPGGGGGYPMGPGGMMGPGPNTFPPPHGMMMQPTFVRHNMMMAGMDGSQPLPPGMIPPGYGPPNPHMMLMPPGAMRMPGGGVIMMEPRYGPPLPHMLPPGAMDPGVRFPPATVAGPGAPPSMPPSSQAPPTGMYGGGPLPPHMMHLGMMMGGPGTPRMPPGGFGPPGGMSFPGGPSPYLGEEVQPSVNG